MGQGAQWLSGRVLDSRPRGRGFEPHRRHCVVSLSKNINPSSVLVLPRKTRPFITERLLMGRKKNQINQNIMGHQQTVKNQFSSSSDQVLHCLHAFCTLKLLPNTPWNSNCICPIDPLGINVLTTSKGWCDCARGRKNVLFPETLATLTYWGLL